MGRKVCQCVGRCWEWLSPVVTAEVGEAFNAGAVSCMGRWC